MTVGILAPSETAIMPFDNMVFASSSKISFWVAHGIAKSAVIPQGRLPAWYSAPLNFSAYSEILPLRTFFSSITHCSFSSLIPSLSKINPAESDNVSTLPPLWLIFSAAKVATLPDPDIKTFLPSILSPFVLSISSRK